MWITKNNLKISRLLVLSLILIGAYARSEEGVTDNAILVGQSVVDTGTNEAAAYGKVFKQGSATYFDKVNSLGGVNGRKIKVIYRDDAFDPKKAVENTREFISKDKVFCLFGYFGSPASAAVRPVYQKLEVPYIGPFSGLDLLRSPVDKNTFTVRASATQEAEALVNYAVDQLHLKKIAIVHRDDAFGDSGRRGIVAALLKRDLRPATIASFKFGDDKSLETPAKLVTESQPDGVIVWSTTEPTAVFLKLLRGAGYKKPVLGPTNAARQETLDLAGSASENFFVTFALPVADDGEAYPIVKEYLQDSKDEALKKVDSYAFEGYVNARVFVEGLTRAGRDLTRKSLRDAFESMKNVNIGGLRVNFSAANHQGLDKVFLAKAKDGKYVMIK